MSGLAVAGKVGLQSLAKGAEQPFSQGRRGELLAQLLGGRYLAEVLEGGVFHAVCADPGVAPGTAIGTAAAMSLYNPAGSGKRLVPLGVSVAYRSGTIGAGTMFLCANTNPLVGAPTAGTEITPLNALLGSAIRPAGKAYYTVTLAAAPTIIRPVCSLTAIDAAATPGLYAVQEDLGGVLVIDEGCILSLEAVAAAGTTPKVITAFSWLEIDKLT